MRRGDPDMSSRPFIVLSIVLGLIFISISMQNVEAADIPKPKITQVSVNQSNLSGVFRFDLYINGTAEGIAKKMNCTFSIQNSTSSRDGPWIDPVNLILFGNGIQFRSAGSGNDTWSKWRFHIQITYDIEKGPGMITDLFGGWLGINISDVDPGQIDNIDINDTKAFFKIRAYDSKGKFGEASTDITDELKAAFIPATPDDGGDEIEGSGSGEDLTLPILLIGIGALLIFIAMIAWIFYFRKRGDKSRGLGYSHERF